MSGLGRQTKRWVPKGEERASVAVDTLRIISDALIEVRGSPVLPQKQGLHVAAAIAHVSAVLANSDGDHPLTCLEGETEDPTNRATGQAQAADGTGQ